MTISSQQGRQAYAGAGTTGPFTVPFKFFSASDLKVVRQSSAGVDSTLTLNVDYTVTGAGNELGGSVTTTVNVAIGETLNIILDPPRTQATDYVSNDAFPAESHERALDRLTQQNIRTRDIVNRTLRQPDGDFAQIAELPGRTVRAGKFAGFDAQGNPTALSGTGNDSALRTDLASTVVGADGALLVGFRHPGAGSVGRTTAAKLREWVSVTDFGALLDGVTDDFFALKNAIAALGPNGGRIYIPPGNLAVDSANAVAGVLFPLPSNVSIIGAGLELSTITVTGATVCHLFKAQNKKNIGLAELSIVGNNTSVGFSDACALCFEQTGAAVGIGGNVFVENCRFSNFKGDYWLWFLNTSATFRAENFWIRHNIFESQAGNSRGPTNIAIPDGMVVFQGQANGTVGIVRNAWVHDNYADGTHKKSFGIAWHSTEHVYFTRNVCKDFGNTAIQDDKAAYCFMAYENSAASGGPGGARPDKIYVDSNTIINPRSVGLYVADGNRVYARGNSISGQSDTSDVTLAKGAIVFNSCKYAEASGNWIDDCYGGVVLNGGAADNVQRALNNRISAVKDNGFGVSPIGAFAGKVGEHEVSGNSIDATGAGSRAIFLRYNAAQGVSRLLIKNNVARAALRCIDLSSDSGAADVQYAAITDNEIVGNGAALGINWAGASDAETRATIARNKYTGSWAAAAVMLNLTDSLGLTIKDEEFNDATGITTGFAIRTDGAQGRMEGVRFNGVAAARQFFSAGTEELGVDTPTWVGVRGDYVQNLGVADVVGATWDYAIDGWRYTTAWRAQFTPYQDA